MLPGRAPTSVGRSQRRGSRRPGRRARRCWPASDRRCSPLPSTPVTEPGGAATGGLCGVRTGARTVCANHGAARKRGLNRFIHLTLFSPHERSISLCVFLSQETKHRDGRNRCFSPRQITCRKCWTAAMYGRSLLSRLRDFSRPLQSMAGHSHLGSDRRVTAKGCSGPAHSAGRRIRLKNRPSFDSRLCWLFTASAGPGMAA